MAANKVFRKVLSRALSLLVCLLMLQSVAHAQQVSPDQNGHYYPGIMNIRDLATPDPGIYLNVYNFMAMSNELYDGDGNRVTQVPIGDPPVDVNISSQTGGLTPSFTFAYNVVGSLQYMFMFTPGLLWSNTSVTLMRSGEIEQSEDSVFGISDLSVAPLYLSYSWDQFDLTGGYTVYIPTGKYATGGTDNLGLGYWTHQFQLAGFLYFLERATALMLALTYEVNSDVIDVDVQPGSRLSLDYGYSQYIGSWLELGVFGGNTFQVTDDSGADIYWDDRPRDRKGIIGGAVAIWATDWLQITAKRWWEYGVVSRFKADGFQLNFTFILWMPGEDEG